MLDQCLKHFRLQRDPFLLTPSQSDYCQILQYEKLLKIVLSSFDNRDGFTLVTAEVGSGKTLMARRLIDHLKSDTYVVCYIYNPSASVEVLEKMILEELGIAILHHDNCYQIIHNKLLELARLEKKVILIIDEAQTMSDECLEYIRLLTNLETDSFKLLQVAFFSQPEILKRLKQDHLRQLSHRIVHHGQLTPLSYHESTSYLLQRIYRSGGEGENLFSKKTRKLIWKFSHGNPRSMNILSKRALICAYAHGDVCVKPKYVSMAQRELTLSLSSLSANKEKKFKNAYFYWFLLVIFLLTIAMGGAYYEYSL